MWDYFLRTHDGRMWDPVTGLWLHERSLETLTRLRTHNLLLDVEAYLREVTA